MELEQQADETPIERVFHRNSYSGRDCYCKFQGSCEGYSYSCRLGEITPNECGFSERIARAERLRVQKAKRLG